MPAVKRKKAKKKSARSKRSSGFFDRFTTLFSTFSTAAVAGLSVVFVVAVLLLWSGGYFGLLTEQANRVAQRTAIAAGVDIKQVTARGHRQTSDADIMSAIGPVVGASLAHFDIHGARARVEDLGWVRSAAVSRLWPNTIHISVREREPAAVWQLSGDLHLIDPSGAVIQPVGAYEYSNLPLIVGAGAPDAVSDILGALRSESELWGEAAALVRVGDRRWNLRLKSGADIRFPENDVEDAVKTLARLQTAYGLLDRPIEYVDLRDPSRLVYRERRDGEPATDEQILR